MMFAFRLNLILVVTMLPAWTSYSAQAGRARTIQSRRLRGQTDTPRRTQYTHEIRLDSPQQNATKSQAEQKEIYNIDAEIIDEQEEALSEAVHERMRRNDKALHALPSGILGGEFNSSLYEELHSAPFEIYESAFGLDEEDRDDSFPVFVVPHWNAGNPGVYSGMSRTGTPFTFQNMQLLLSWRDIVEASTGAEEDLANFIHNNNFQASLFIGKTIGDSVSQVPFLGLIVSYHQSSQKNILIPFAKLENFFHDTSEKHLLSELTHNLEHDALHAMLDTARAENSTSSFFHPDIVADTRNNNRKHQLEDIEALHFRRLFQLLIRRTFLFSFGYADCLKEEPHHLRSCLDDTFSLVVQMEAAVRDAMDDQLIAELAKVTKLTKTSKVREACVSVSPGSFGMNDCSSAASDSFRGLGGGMPRAAFATYR